MQLLTLGVNHHTAPLAIREQVAFGPEKLVQALHELTQSQRASEVAILSTCNRTELYVNTPSPDDVAVTKLMVEAGRLLDIPVHDHLVIGQQRFVSLKERGLGFS